MEKKAGYLAFFFILAHMRKLILWVGACLFSYYAYSGIEEDIQSNFDQAYSFFATQQWDSSLLIAEKTYQLAKDKNNSWGKANSLFIKGWSLYKQNDLSQALVHYLEALRVMQTEMDPNDHSFDRSSIHHNIGLVYTYFSNYDEAIKFYNEGLVIAEEYDHQKLVANFIYNLGNVYKYKGDLANSADYFLKAKLKAFNSQNKLKYFKTINQLGLINKDLERYDSARTLYQEAILVAKDLKKPEKQLAKVYHNIANTYLLQGNYDLAAKNFEEALKHKQLFITLNDYSEMLVNIQLYHESLKYAELAKELYPDQKLSGESAVVYSTLSKANYALGNTDGGLKYLETYMSEIDRYLDEREYSKKLADSYQIDLLTKQYFLTLEQQKKEAKIASLSWFVGLIIVGFLLVFAIQRYIVHHRKVQATNAIRDVIMRSELLRGL